MPYVTVEQMREVDRAMVEDFGIALLQMMENAGRALAIVARERFFGGDGRGHRATVLCGAGGNGGGGLVCARRLHAWGCEVTVCLSAPAARFEGAARHQIAILENVGLRVNHPGDSFSLPAADLIVDALIGYSLRGAPVGPAAKMIEAVNAADGFVLSLDMPSGIAADTGSALDIAIKADATLTLALPKIGLVKDNARPYVGELYLADIGVPTELYGRVPLCLSVGSVFARGDVVRLF